MSGSPSRSQDRDWGALLRIRAAFPFASSTPSLWKRWLVTSEAGLSEWDDKALPIFEIIREVEEETPPRVSKAIGMNLRPACSQASPLWRIFLS